MPVLLRAPLPAPVSSPPNPTPTPVPALFDVGRFDIDTFGS